MCSGFVENWKNQFKMPENGEQLSRGIFTHPEHKGLKEPKLIETLRALKDLYVTVLFQINVQIRKKHRRLRIPSVGGW